MLQILTHCRFHSKTIREMDPLIDPSDDYMTIAAAAFGLISDGCMCQIFSIVKGFYGSETLCSADQNNLMTMSNVS